MTLPGWQYEKPKVQIAKIRTLGYVVGSSDDAISISSSVGTQGAILDPCSIPWKAIVGMEFLDDEWDR